MTDKPLRPQLNIRLDKHPSLLDDIKQAASDRNTTASQFVLDAILRALGKPTTTTPTDTASLEAILAEVDELIDAKLDKRLKEFERRLLAEFRQDDRQSATEEDRQVVEEARPETRPDYQEMRDRVLKSLTTGRGRIAPSAPQYKSAVKVLDRFITEIQGDTKTPPGDST
ncbi:MAG: hypothetical protein HWQ38_02345 [Nostoc sp. NMS7]|uniref:hypothetical protein n=1 Tax=Nostoc sp. NMS7 TaxID=2815391 RepID=UPI0025D4614C|nr:hypothetical protein [Nostoc sp. NMS7]MBN3945380.1 hypothetical protein [Nostoc sp. NMS7]